VQLLAARRNEQEQAKEKQWPGISSKGGQAKPTAAQRIGIAPPPPQ
jgi:hypothetical protein